MDMTEVKMLKMSRSGDTQAHSQAETSYNTVLRGFVVQSLKRSLL